jgi:hypothetical protein
MDSADGAFDLELAAASLRADAADVRVLLRALIDQLADALGSRMRVERAGGRFRKSQEVRSLAVDLGDDQFTAEIDGDVLRCAVGRVSGGIRIRTEQIDVDTWLHRLLARLQGEAAQSQTLRLALERIVIGEPQ